MMRLRAQVSALILGTLYAGVIGCQATSHARRVSDEEARRVVRRFVVLDSSGRGYLAEAVSLFLPCDGRVSDQVEPVLATILGQSFRLADTVAFPIGYHVVGYAHSRDEGQVGTRNWTFQFAPASRTDTMRVVRDSTGAVRIACGPFYGNHPDVTSLEWLAAKLDSVSAIDWMKALSLTRE